MIRTLITGISGFAGRHLAAACVAAGEEVSGLARDPMPQGIDPGVTAKISFHTADLQDGPELTRLIDTLRPDRLFHLAGWASVGRSIGDPAAAFQANTLGSLNLLEALRKTGFRGRLLLVSSSEVYGAAAHRTGPTSEDVRLLPVSPYAASKAAVEVIAGAYQRIYDLDLVTARPSNHTGPGQAPSFVASDWARQIARIEAGLQEPVLRVGRLESVRDFSHAADIVLGYRKVMERGRCGEVYNLGSGKGRPVQAILDHYLSRARRPIRVEQDPARLRDSDMPCLICDIAKVRRDCGWSPERTLEQALDELLEDWRQGLTKGLHE